MVDLVERTSSHKDSTFILSSVRPDLARFALDVNKRCLRVSKMPLQAGSSELLWQEAGGLDSDIGDVTPEPQKKGHRKRDSEHLGDTEGEAPSTLRLDGGSIDGINNEEVRLDQQTEDGDGDEEYTRNPDQELEDIQADKHAAYEGQQFYGKIQFGESVASSNDRPTPPLKLLAGLANTWQTSAESSWFSKMLVS